MTVLPGVKKGISGSIIFGNNISIAKYPNDKAYDKRKEAALFVFKYLASREVQKEFLTKRILIPGIMDLYYDEDVCKIAHCQLFRSIQPIGKPIFERDDYNYYAEKFKLYFSEFLYGNVSAKDALKNIKDISYIYEISTSTKYTSAGLINFLIFSVIITFMLLSLIFIFLNNFNPFFEFLSQEYWILIVFGSIMNLSACFTKFGTLTSFKCQLSILLLSLGFSFSFIPILNKLIINFPEVNKISTWIDKHQYIFHLINFSIDILLNGLMYIKPYHIHTNYIEGGQNFQICEINNFFGNSIYILIIIYKIIILLIILILIFIEWNNQKFHNDLKFIITAIYIFILGSIILLILNFITINNYIFYYLIRGYIMVIISTSLYMFIYGYRIIFGILHKQNLKLQFINNINKKFISSENNSESNSKQIYHTKSYAETSFYNDSNNDKTKSNISNKTSKTNKSNKTSKTNKSSKTAIISKIISYHYSIEENDELELRTNIEENKTNNFSVNNYV